MGMLLLVTVSPTVGNPIASILKSNVEGIPARFFPSPVPIFLGVTIFAIYNREPPKQYRKLFKAPNIFPTPQHETSVQADDLRFVISTSGVSPRAAAHWWSGVTDMLRRATQLSLGFGGVSLGTSFAVL